MPKVSQEHLAARKEQIVSAAFRCFADKGFHPTTMQDICAAAELSAGAVYRYFKSKEDIIASACTGAEAYDGAVLVDEASKALDTAAALDMLALKFFSSFEEPEADSYNRAVLQLWAEAAVNDQIRELLHERSNPLAEAFVRFARSAQRRGDFGARFEPEAIAALFFALYDGFRLRKTFDQSLSTKAYRELVVAVLTGDFWTGSRIEDGDEAQQGA